MRDPLTREQLEAWDKGAMSARNTGADQLGQTALHYEARVSVLEKQLRTLEDALAREIEIQVDNAPLAVREADERTMQAEERAEAAEAELEQLQSEKRHGKTKTCQEADEALMTYSMSFACEKARVRELEAAGRVVVDSFDDENTPGYPMQKLRDLLSSDTTPNPRPHAPDCDCLICDPDP